MQSFRSDAAVFGWAVGPGQQQIHRITKHNYLVAAWILPSHMFRTK
jgi:hypothetical protein